MEHFVIIPSVLRPGMSLFFFLRLCTYIYYEDLSRKGLSYFFIFVVGFFLLRLGIKSFWTSED